MLKLALCSSLANVKVSYGRCGSKKVWFRYKHFITSNLKFYRVNSFLWVNLGSTETSTDYRL